MQILLTYNEYCEILGSIPEGIDTPQWFNPTQLRALTIISNDITQAHLFPLTKLAYDSLKPYYKKEVATGIAYEIQFIKDNPEIFNSPFISNTSIGVGEFNKGPMNSGDIKWLLTHMCPVAKEFFMNIGWCWSSLNKKLRYSDYYGDIDYHVMWGKIGGDILLQPDLIAMFTSSTLEVDDKAIANVKISKELTNTIILKEDGLYSSPAPYELPIASPTELGGVKTSNDFNIANDGVLSLNIKPSNLPIATFSTVGAIKTSNDFTITNDGTLMLHINPYNLPIASPTELGAIKVGNNLSINTEGVLSATVLPYDLPTASNIILGGIKVGNNLSIDNEGILSATVLPYDLPTASTTQLGGVKVGANLSIDNEGVLSAKSTESSYFYERPKQFPKSSIAPAPATEYLSSAINAGDSNVAFNSRLGNSVNVANYALSGYLATNNYDMTILNCSYNNLNYVDVSNSSSKLVTLNCDVNLLHTLNVSSCYNLSTLRCSQNKISTLDLKINSNLTLLDCGQNNLTELDLRNNSQLINVKCNHNQLKTIDVSKCFKLEILDILYNKLSTIDVSRNSKLLQLTVDSNSLLTSIDITNLPLLFYFSAIACSLTSIDLTHNPNLTSVKVGGNRISELDVSQNRLLQTLNTYNCELLTAIDVSNNPKLKALTINYCVSLSSLDLSHNVLLENLNIDQNFLINWIDLRNNPNLKQISAQSSGLETLDLHSCPNLTQVYFSYSAIARKLYLPATIITTIGIWSATNLGDIYTKVMSGNQAVNTNSSTKRNIIIHRPTGSTATFSSSGITFTYVNDNN